MTRRATLVTLLLAGLAALHGAAAPAQSSRQTYQSGLDAAEAANWPEAARLMTEAIREKPDAERRFLRSYTPYYYLGLALYHLGDCPGAVRAWNASERQGVITRSDEFQNLKEKRRQCQSLIEASERLDRSLAAATALADDLRKRRNERSVKALWVGDIAASWETATEMLAEAARTAAAGTALPSLEELDKAKQEADQSAARMAEISRALDTGLEQRRINAEARLQGLREEVRAELDRTAELEPFPPGLEDMAGRLEGLLAESETTDTADRMALVAFTDELEERLEEFAAATLPPPAWLAGAAAAFLGGDYAAVVASLAEAQAETEREQAHARLLASAAAWALSRAPGGTVDHLARAREELRALLVVDSELVPRPELFSPDFVAFYEQEKRGPAETAPPAP